MLQYKPKYYIKYYFIFLSVLSFAALLPIENYGFYIILRWLLVVGFLLAIYVIWGKEQIGKGIIAAIGLYLFQPLDPIEATKTFWIIPNILAGLYFLWLNSYITEGARAEYENFDENEKEEIAYQTHKLNLEESQKQKRNNWQESISKEGYKAMEEMRPYDPNYFDEDERFWHGVKEFIYVVLGILFIILVLAMLNSGISTQ